MKNFRNFLKKYKFIVRVYQILLTLKNNASFVFSKSNQIGSIQLDAYKVEKNNFCTEFSKKLLPNILILERNEKHLFENYKKNFSFAKIKVDEFSSFNSAIDIIKYSKAFYNFFLYNNKITFISVNPFSSLDLFICSTNDFKYRVAIFDQNEIRGIDKIVDYYDFFFFKKKLLKKITHKTIYNYKTSDELIFTLEKLFFELNNFDSNQSNLLYVENISSIDHLMLNEIKEKITPREIYVHSSLSLKFNMNHDSELIQNKESDFKNIIFLRKALDIFPQIEDLCIKDKLNFFISNNFIIKNISS